MLQSGHARVKRPAALTTGLVIRMIDETRARLYVLTDLLLSRLYGSGAMNLVEDYASLLPAFEIAAILGLSVTDVPRLARLVGTLTKTAPHSDTPADLERMEAAAAELTDYVGRLIDYRRRRPRGDFLSSYARALEESGESSPLEAMMQIISFILAGSDVTRAGMTIQLSLLLQHHKQWRTLCRTPGLIPQAVREAMRHEPAIGSVLRSTIEDIDLGGYRLPKDSIVSLMMISAMRDPDLYADPDEFNIFRSHPCEGADEDGQLSLADAMTKLALEAGLAALTCRMPDLRIDGDWPSITGYAGIRRTSEMKLAWPTSAT
jgi:cytochrome P450